MKLGPLTDALLYRRLQVQRSAAPALPETRALQLPAGTLRVLDTGGNRPALLMAPDGPCVIEHYQALISDLRADFRVVCIDLPGFGMSAPQAGYHHGLRQGAEVLLGALEALEIDRATLALSCVNGFYGIVAAQLQPRIVQRLILCQTPSLEAMQQWVQRTVPKAITWPVIGQLLSFQGRARIAQGWFKAALARREDRPAFQAISHQNIAHGGCFCFAGVVQGTNASRHELQERAAPQVPTTLIWGDADRSHQATDPHSIQTLLPQAEVIRLPGVGHFPDLEASTEFARILRQLHQQEVAA